MSVWAYECRSCDEGPAARWHVAAAAVAEMPPEVRRVRVRVGTQWRCAVVDREHPVAVEQMLLRDVVASDEVDCPDRRPAGAQPEPDEAAAPPSAATAAVATPPVASSPAAAASGSDAPLRGAGRHVQAAAISLQGQRLVVVLVSMDLVASPGEADLAAATLAPRFGGVPVVLMAQQEDGSPRYHGDTALLELLEGVPLERMPWKEYPVG